MLNTAQATRTRNAATNSSGTASPADTWIGRCGGQVHRVADDDDGGGGGWDPPQPLTLTGGPVLPQMVLELVGVVHRVTLCARLTPPGVRSRLSLSSSPVIGGSEATVNVVVDDADVLHERVHTRGSHESVSLRLQLLRKSLRLRVSTWAGLRRSAAHISGPAHRTLRAPRGWATPPSSRVRSRRWPGSWRGYE